MSYHKRFKAMKKALQDTNQTISQITGLSEERSIHKNDW